jgi:hypothetical protein
MAGLNIKKCRFCHFLAKSKYIDNGWIFFHENPLKYTWVCLKYDKMVCSMKKYCFHDFFSISKKWSFLDIFCKMLRMSQGIAKSHVSVYRWNQRWISFKLSPNNRNSGDHWKNVITGTLQKNVRKPLRKGILTGLCGLLIYVFKTI